MSAWHCRTFIIDTAMFRTDDYEKPVMILGIESSCDETAAAVVEDGARVLSNVVASDRKSTRLNSSH